MTVSVSVADTVIFVATCEKRIPLFAAPLAVEVVPFPKSPNSRCVPVASPAAKNVDIYPIAPEYVVLCWALRTTSVPSWVSVIAGVVVLDPRAI